MDDETREKLRQNTLKRKGWNHTQEVKDFLSEIKSNPVIQLDLDGKFIREWKNAGEAAHFYGGVGNCIRSVAKKITTTSYGYIWVYKDEYDPLTFDVIEHFKRNKTIRRVVQLDLDNNYINTFRSISDAKLKTGASNIHVVCKGIQHKSGGYKWMFEEDYLKSKE